MNRPVIPLEELGSLLIHLGEQLKNPDATLRDLVGASEACGLRFQFRMVNNETNVVLKSSEEPDEEPNGERTLLDK